MTASRSPRLALSRAAHNSATGTRKGAPSRSHLADLHHQLQPAATVGRGVPIQQRGTQRELGQEQCGIVAGSRGDLHRLLARAHRGVIGPKHAVLHRDCRRSS